MRFLEITTTSYWSRCCKSSASNVHWVGLGRESVPRIHGSNSFADVCAPSADVTMRLEPLTRHATRAVAACFRFDLYASSPFYAAHLYTPRCVAYLTHHIEILTEAPSRFTRPMSTVLFRNCDNLNHLRSPISDTFGCLIEFFSHSALSSNLEEVARPSVCLVILLPQQSTGYCHASRPRSCEQRIRLWNTFDHRVRSDSCKMLIAVSSLELRVLNRSDLTAASSMPSISG